MLLSAPKIHLRWPPKIIIRECVSIKHETKLKITKNGFITHGTFSIPTEKKHLMRKEIPLQGKGQGGGWHYIDTSYSQIWKWSLRDGMLNSIEVFLVAQAQRKHCFSPLYNLWSVNKVQELSQRYQSYHYFHTAEAVKVILGAQFDAVEYGFS